MTRDAPGAGLADPETSSLFSPVPDDGPDRFLLEAPSLGPTRPLPTPAPGATDDGTRLWVLGESAPDAWTLAVADLERDSIRRAATIPRDGPVPAVDPSTGVAHAVVDGRIERYDPRAGAGDSLESTRSIDADADLERAVAGLTRSADGDRLAVLVDRDGERCVASVYLPTGETDVWHSDAIDCDVVRFSPTDPTLLLYARETPLDGDDSARAWLAREGLGARPLSAQLPRRHRGYWWRPDGGGLRFVDPDAGVASLDLELGHRRTDWDVPALTAHATRDGRRLAAAVAGEGGPRLCARSADGSSVDVAPLAPPVRGWRPQPTFEASERALAYATVADGRPRVAITPVSALR